MPHALRACGLSGDPRVRWRQVGGAIYSYGDLTLITCTLKDNQATSTRAAVGRRPLAPPPAPPPPPPTAAAAGGRRAAASAAPGGVAERWGWPPRGLGGWRVGVAAMCRDDALRPSRLVACAGAAPRVRWRQMAAQS